MGVGVVVRDQGDVGCALQVASPFLECMDYPEQLLLASPIVDLSLGELFAGVCYYPPFLE